MDQDTFRSFLTTPRPGAAAASSSSARHSSGASLGAAGAAPKRAAGYNPYTNKPATTREHRADDGGAPKKKTWTSKKADKYIDRAAARRQGLDNEFTEVLAVRDEFERRQEGDDAADVEAKRQLLGGDAEHSILVKGLDLALLARNKAALEATQAESDDEDDVLEAAYGAGAGSADLPSAADDESTTGRKRSREEILAAVQSKRRALGRPVESSAPAASDLNRSKFKPIGFKEDKKAKKKAVVGPDGHVKKLKKKAKAPRPAEPDSAVAEPATALDIETAAVAPLKAEPSPAGPSSPPTAPAVVAAAPARSPPPPPAEKRFAKPLISANLSDDDIFGGVGEYEAELPSDSDEDDGEGAPKASTSKAATAVKIEEGEETTPVPKVNWFKTGRTPSPPPTPAGQIPSPKGKERAIDAGAADDRGGSRSPSPEPVMRLVPLSGTSAREMLARAEAAEQAAIRRSNKAKWRQSQGLAKQADGGEDDEDDEGQGGWRGKQKEETVDKKRLNHEYQQYQNYAKKLEK